MKTLYFGEVTMTAERRNPVRRVDFGIASDKEEMILRCPEAHVREYAHKLGIVGIIRADISVKRENDGQYDDGYEEWRTFELISRMDSMGNIYVREMTDEDYEERWS